MTDAKYYREERPWGHFTVLFQAANYQVKEIRVLPGSRLSYQTHERRSEHWLVISGEATVTLNDKELVLNAGDSLDIAVKDKHRLANQSKSDLVIIEVQRGDYFGEDDIVRIADDYNRT